jgi:predicted RecA/RadA family phage recombinase
MTPPDIGTFPLDDVASLPNVSVAFPGEVWTNHKATEIIVPGEGCMPTVANGRLAIRRALDTDAGDPRLGVAMNVVQHPDGASDSTYTSSLGPNEIVNRAIPVGQYVRRYLSGVFHLTLVTPRAWVPGELVGWDDGAARPTGKGGAGAWNLAASAAAAWGEVLEFRKVNASDEGILTVRSLAGQF